MTEKWQLFSYFVADLFFFLLKIVAAQALDKSRHEWHVCGPVQHLHKSPDRLNWLWGGQVQRSIPVDYKSIKRDTRQQILKENSLMARYFICFLKKGFVPPKSCAKWSFRKLATWSWHFEFFCLSFEYNANRRIVERIQWKIVFLFSMAVEDAMLNGDFSKEKNWRKNLLQFLFVLFVF